MAWGGCNIKEMTMEEITCSTCGELFTDSRNGSKTFPCLHAFCITCILTRWLTETRLEMSTRRGSAAGAILCCPLCQMETEVQEAASAVNRDAILINGCGGCKEDTPAVSWCMQCGNLLCENCNTFRHQKVQSHYVIGIEEFLQKFASGSALGLTSSSCHSHGKQLTMHFNTCASQVCQDCIIKDHSKHKLTMPKELQTDINEMAEVEQRECKQQSQQNDAEASRVQLLPNRSSEYATVKPQTNQKTIQCVCTHRTESLYLYCVTCNGLICQDCTIGGHHKHHFATVNRLFSAKVKSKTKPLTQPSSLRRLFRCDDHDPTLVSLVTEKKPPCTGNDDSVSKTDWLNEITMHKTSGKKKHGYTAPFNLLEENEWYFGGIAHGLAEKFLMQRPNMCGSFLIRDSKVCSSGYSLVLRETHIVKHYKVNQLENGKYFLTTEISFGTLSDLIAHYSKELFCYHTNLKAPCVANEPRHPMKKKSSSWEVYRNSFRFVKKVGIGAYTELWHGVWNDTMPVVIKVFNSKEAAAEFLEEATLIKQLRHPNVIELYGVSTQKKLMWIVYELLSNNLLYYVRGNRTLKLAQLTNFGAQVASGMAYLEETMCIPSYGELCAKQILLSDHLICKIADFRTAQNLKHMRYPLISISWSAPEAVLHHLFTFKSDVWSFGILLYQLVTYGGEPYPGRSSVEVLVAVQNGYRLPCPDNCPLQLHEIMMECWKHDAKTRPTFTVLIQQLEDFFIEEFVIF
ncbi:tyrosine-protein kinase-like isoform X2 [Dysidea avara]|uniref:tyrosine-protein kinase-like isoform X2 n=1 Tax=Dysidea avara TaxID=196820 RepID=UPI00332F42B0